MRRTSAALAALAFSAFAAAAVAESLAVPLNQVVRISLRGAASDVLIGNDKIADVALIDERTVAVSGKTYGSTNLLVLDGARRVLFNGQVTVASAGGQVTVHRGPDSSQYACVHRCEAIAK